ncbi:MAG TPA: hypothetical protein VN963_00655 [bacterium]|nr:hypothetical protein [bacterium]
MKRVLLILMLILLFGEMLDDDKNCGSMNMPGGKPPGIDGVPLGAGPNAKVCPITGKVLQPGQEIEVVLSNGRKIRLCCPDCRKPVEKDLKKYEGLMY